MLGDDDVGGLSDGFNPGSETDDVILLGDAKIGRSTPEGGLARMVSVPESISSDEDTE